jgi:DNA replication protein DnaC
LEVNATKQAITREQAPHDRVPPSQASPSPVKEPLGGVLARIRGVAPGNPESQPSCGALDWSLSSRPVPKREYCDGVAHYEVRGAAAGALIVVRRCPELRRHEIRTRIDDERVRLKKPLKKLAAHGGARFDGFDGTRHPSAAKALAAMRRFAAGRPPSRNVLLFGPSGLGKTRLLLASHFQLLAVGVHSEYVTSPELRDWFKQADNFDQDVAANARYRLQRICRAEVVHADDLGHIEGDTRGRGAFAEGLKTLLDNSDAAWATATNRSGEEAEKHPDLSGTIVSRLQQDADVIEMNGVDFRQETARLA